MNESLVVEFELVGNCNVVGFQVMNSNGSFSSPAVEENFFIEIDCCCYYVTFAHCLVVEDYFDKLEKFLDVD